MLLPSQRPPAVTIIFGPVSPIGPSLQMWPHTYLVAIGANLLQNYFGTQSEEHFFKSSPL
jgi:hypothetical protein